MMTVVKNIVVAFRYIMKNNNGEVIENTMEGTSKYYLHGSEGIHSSLQAQFEGLKAGDHRVIYLKKENGVSEDFSFDVVIDELRPASKEEVALGYPVIIDNLVCDSDCTCYKDELPLFTNHNHLK